MTATARARFTLAGASNKVRLAALTGMTVVIGYVAAVNPEKGGAYPPSPGRALLGLDCPFCGGTRATHDLLNGRIVEALDHNLLLPGLLGVMGVMFALWLLPLIGKPARVLTPPGWVVKGAVAVLVAFTVARNLPIPALEFLASDSVS